MTVVRPRPAAAQSVGHFRDQPYAQSDAAKKSTTAEGVTHRFNWVTAIRRALTKLSHPVSRVVEHWMDTQSTHDVFFKAWSVAESPSILRPLSRKNSTPAGSERFAAANAPFNCPLMALPWANNLTIDNLSYVGSSLFSTQGVDITALKNALRSLVRWASGTRCRHNLVHG